MFDFPKADRDQINSFNRNYLRSVIFQINFDNNENILSNKGEIIEIFKDTFTEVLDSKHTTFEFQFKQDLTPIFYPIGEKQSGFILKSKDGFHNLTIATDVISYTVRGSIYQNFDQLEAKFLSIEKLLELCNIKFLNRVAVRKVNIIDINPGDIDNKTPIDILGTIINGKLLTHFEYFPNYEYIKQNMHTVTLAELDSRLNLRYGLVLPQNSDKSNIVIDIDLFNVGKTSASDIKTLANDINNEIYNIFIWSISKEALEKLKSE